MAHGRPDTVVDRYIAAADAGIVQFGSVASEPHIDRRIQDSL